MNSMKRQKDVTLKDESPSSLGVQYTTAEEQRNSYRKNKEAEPKQKQCPVVVVSDGESKVPCCKEQYCVRIWNVRSMNQIGVVKQEMVRVNISILGINELKSMGKGEFNSDDHYIYHCGQEYLRRNGVSLVVNKRVQNAVLGCNLKNNRVISVHFHGKPLNTTVFQVRAPTTDAEKTEAE